MYQHVFFEERGKAGRSLQHRINTQTKIHTWPFSFRSTYAFLFVSFLCCKCLCVVSVCYVVVFRCDWFLQFFSSFLVFVCTLYLKSFVFFFPFSLLDLVISSNFYDAYLLNRHKHTNNNGKQQKEEEQERKKRRKNALVENLCLWNGPWTICSYVFDSFEMCFTWLFVSSTFQQTVASETK